MGKMPPDGITEHDNLNGITAADHHPPGPEWVEDGNSPVSVSGATTLSYTLADSYDHVMVVLDSITGSATTSETLYLQINGDTGTDYHYWQMDATNHSAVSNWGLYSITPSGAELNGQLLLDGDWNSYAGISAELPTNVGGALVGGNNNAVAGPLSSFTLQWTSGSITGKLRVYGLNL